MHQRHVTAAHLIIAERVKLKNIVIRPLRCIGPTRGHVDNHSGCKMRKSTYLLRVSLVFPALISIAANSRAQDVQTAAQTTSPISANAPTVTTADQLTPAPRTGSCAMRVYTAQSVAGVTTKSGFAKFALGTLLPSIAGSVGGSHDLTTQSSIAGNNATANRASDVPAAIASTFTQAGQATAIGTLTSGLLSKLDSAPAVFDDGAAPTNGLDAARFGLSDTRCVRVLTIDSITFEHSKDYKARNAVVMLSSLVEYRGGAKKPSTRVFGESRTPITPFDVAQDTSSPELKAELDGAIKSAITDLFQRFEKKRK